MGKPKVPGDGGYDLTSPVDEDHPLPAKVWSGTVPAHWYNVLIDRVENISNLFWGCDSLRKEQDKEIAKLKEKIEGLETSLGYYRRNEPFRREQEKRLEAAEEEIRQQQFVIADLRAQLKKCQDDAAKPVAFQKFKARQAARAGRPGRAVGGGGGFVTHNCAAEVAAAVAAAGATFPTTLFDINVTGHSPYDVLVAAPTADDAIALLAALPGGEGFSYLAEAGWQYDADSGTWLDLPLL